MTRSISARTVRRTLASALLFAALLLLFPFSAPQAEAAEGDHTIEVLEGTEGGYTIEVWEGTEGGYPASFYRLYENQEETVGVPTFYTTSLDHYVSVNTGSDVSITFYRYYDAADDSQAEAFCSYLLESAPRPCFIGWYGYDSDNGVGNCFVYQIEGVDLSAPEPDAALSLIKFPFKNEEGVELYMPFIGYGNCVAEDWDFIIHTLDCSSAIYVEQDGAEGMTFGFAFYDRTQTEPVLRYYCMD